MENASKALLIGGAVAIMIILLSLAMYVWAEIGGATSEYYTKMENSKIGEFNQQFLSYANRNIERDQYGNAVRDEKGKVKNALNFQDVVTIINLATDNTEKGTFLVYNNDEDAFSPEIEVSLNIYSSPSAIGTTQITIPKDDKTTINKNELTEFLNEKMLEYTEKNFECTNIEYDEKTSIVKKITIVEIK